MKICKILLPVTAILLFSGPANAQSDDSDVRSENEARKAAYGERLRDAEERLEVAAREIAEISRERLPQMFDLERRFAFSNKPRIGITIDGSDQSGPVEGVEIVAVTPDSAADDVGLHAGDVITAINSEPMGADNSHAADMRLLDFMQGVEEGDELKVDYIRNGNAGSVELSPKVMEMHAFSWIPGVGDLHIRKAPGFALRPEAIEKFRFQFGFPMSGSAWSNMELVELSEGLGKYFGTDSGLLVVSAPALDGLGLQDGDVIQSIDGREPTDVRHALRILSSYQGGEKLNLGIMRDKKKRTLEIEVPADHRGALFAPAPVSPARAPLPAKRPRVLPDEAST